MTDDHEYTDDELYELNQAAEKAILAIFLCVQDDGTFSWVMPFHDGVPFSPPFSSLGDALRDAARFFDETPLTDIQARYVPL